MPWHPPLYRSGANAVERKKKKKRPFRLDKWCSRLFGFGRFLAHDDDCLLNRQVMPLLISPPPLSAATARREVSGVKGAGGRRVRRERLILAAA